jgi:uncharacterized membrane protein required for colicin V production
MTFAHVFDVGAALVLAFFVVRGAVRGLTGEIVSLLGLVASVLCGWTFAGPLAGVVHNYFPTWSRSMIELLCALVIFICVSLVFTVLSKIVHTLVKAANLAFVDHVMGAVSGGARAFFVVLFIYGAMTIFSPVLPNEWMKNSVAMKGAAVVWPPVYKVMTDNGWLDPGRLTPDITGTGVLTDFLNVKPASADM